MPTAWHTVCIWTVLSLNLVQKEVEFTPISIMS